MFYYFGSKERLAKFYPPPQFRTIVEPFAGSAGYSRLHWQSNVVLIERDERVVALWKKLRQMSVDEAMNLPAPSVGAQSRDLLVMLRAASEHSLTGEYITVTDRMVSRWGQLRRKIADCIPKVQHWEIICGDYSNAPDIQATWFIDPPYANMNRGYAFKPDYDALSLWCRSRNGQIIVCEKDGADWLPFSKLTSHRTTNNGHSIECVWIKSQIEN